MSARPNIVLVHGAWADGSSWNAVIEHLQADGYNVTAPQFPESSLAADVARLREVLHRQDGPTAVARPPPRGGGQGPPTPALAHLDIDAQGFAWLPEEDFVKHFAADVDPVRARVMCAVQQPVAAAAFQDVMGVPAWRSVPTWYMVATADEAIPPDAERQFATRMGATTIEVPSSHVAMVSHPDEVTQLIEAAAKAVTPGN